MNRHQSNLQVGNEALGGKETILVCPNAFKGSLSASDAARAIEEGIMCACSDSARAMLVQRLPVADGGDGTLQTLVEATDGTIETAEVQDPLGRPIEAQWGRLGGDRRDTAVIEMAQASGLRLLRPDEYAPDRTSTYGTGQLMLAALEAGCRTLLIGIGGSATNDGGAGMAEALGIRFLDSRGNPLPPGGASLAHIERIDCTGGRWPAEATVLVACDVNNPLCGPEGASAIYGPQKGADDSLVAILDCALARYAELLQAETGRQIDTVSGSGAAGGLGAGLMAFCNARLVSGTDLVLDVTGFDRAVRQARLVVTGEGRLDGQTARGKVIAGVIRRARSAGVPVVALTGAIEENAEATLREEGLTAALSILDRPLTVEQSMKEAYSLLLGAAERMMRLVELQL